VDAPRKCYAHYSAADVARALLETMEVFRWITKDVAERLGYRYPTKADEIASEIVGRNLGPVLGEKPDGELATSPHYEF